MDARFRRRRGVRRTLLDVGHDTAPVGGRGARPRAVAGPKTSLLRTLY